MRKLVLLSLLVAAMALTACAHGAAGAEPEEGGSVPLTGIDLSIPTQPAAHVLGIDPSGVQRPGNLRELLVSVVNSLDQRGNLQQGFGLAITGWRIGTVRGEASDFRRERMRLDTEYSIAAVKGATEDDPSAKLGVGISVPLIDDRQVLQDEDEIALFFEAVGKKQPDGLEVLIRNLNELLSKDGQLSRTATLDDVRKKLWYLHMKYVSQGTPTDQLRPLWARFGPLWDAASSDELRRLTEERWNARALSLAAGLAWVSPTGLTDDFRSDRYGLWLRGANPMGKNGQLLYAVSYRDRETVPDPNNEGQFIRQDAWFVGGRYFCGGATQGVSLEVSYSIEDPEEGDSERVRTYLLGWEQRVTKDRWLQMSIGTEGDRSTGDQLLFGFSYNIGLGSKAQIARPKPEGQ